jgi:hypothetical protein
LFAGLLVTACNVKMNITQEISKFIIYNPLAKYEKVSQEGNFAALSTENSIFSFSKEEGRSAIMLNNSAKRGYRIKSSLNDDFVILREINNDHLAKNDFVVYSLKDLKRKFSSNTSDKDEFFYSLVENGDKALIIQQCYFDSTKKLLRYTPGRNLEDLFPSSDDIEIFTEKEDRMKLIGAVKSGRFSIHKLDSVKGTINKLTGNFEIEADSFYPFFPSDVVSGKLNDSVFFIYNNGNSKRVFYPSSYDYEVHNLGISSDGRKAFIKELKKDFLDANFYFFDIQNDNNKMIDFLPFTNWEKKDINSDDVFMGSEKIVFKGKSFNNNISNVLFYDIKKKLVVDEIKDFYPSLLKTSDDLILHKHDDSCLIGLSAEVFPGSNKVKRVLYFDGKDLNDLFEEYANHVEYIGGSEKYAFVKGIKSSSERDIIMLDLETKEKKILYSNSGDCEKILFSDNKEMFSFITKKGDFEELNIYEIKDNLSQKRLRSEHKINVFDFSRDNKNVIYEIINSNNSRQTRILDLENFIDNNICRN